MAIIYFTFPAALFAADFLWPSLFVCESLVAYIYYLANVSLEPNARRFDSSKESLCLCVFSAQLSQSAFLDAY